MCLSQAVPWALAWGDTNTTHKIVTNHQRLRAIILLFSLPNDLGNRGVRFETKKPAHLTKNAKSGWL